MINNFKQLHTKTVNKSLVLICTLFFISGCIETDIEAPLPDNLRIIEPEETFRVSGQYELMAEYTDESGEPAEAIILWESSDPSLLQIDGNIATCLAEGQVFINATVGSKTESLLIEIEASREFIEISNFVEVLQVGNSFTFRAIYIDEGGSRMIVAPNWESSDVNIATVNSLGSVTAVSEGTVNISASFGNVSHQVSLEITNDPVLVDPEIRMTTFTMFLTEGEAFMFEAEYFGEDGQPDPSVALNWTSSNALALSIDSDGQASAITEGTTTVTASFGEISASIEVTVEAVVTERTGTLMGTGYNISGTFKLAENGDGDLILTIENYVTAGPGPYFYLTNQPGNVANGLNLGEARTNGNIEINVSAISASTELNTYQYLMIWCEPFGVRLGFGEFEN